MSTNKDAFGNYAPAITDVLASNAVLSGSGIQLYAGNPTGVLTTAPNTIVLDTVGDTFYFTSDGTTFVTIGGASGGSAQLVTYTAGSPANPTDVTKPALAYDPTGNLPTLGWNTSNNTWN